MVKQAPRARHHTNAESLKKIKKERAIGPAFWTEPVGVHVELEPFGATIPGIGGPAAELGTAFRREGAYVEFDMPEGAISTRVGARLTAVIPTDEPLSLGGRNPVFVVIGVGGTCGFFGERPSREKSIIQTLHLDTLLLSGRSARIR